MNKNTQNPPPATPSKRFAVEIFIGYDPQTQQMELHGPFTNWPLFFELLDMAKENIKAVHIDAIRQQQVGGLVAAPASALNDIDRIAKANGSK